MTGSPALPADERPIDPTPVHTADLPPTPIRDRNIPAAAWIEAPAELLALGDDLPVPDSAGGARPVISYKRRIGRGDDGGVWLLWRAGPATRADARYWAARVDDLTVQHTFRLFPDGTGTGVGPSGERHTRFRTWKEDLLEHS